MNGRLVGKGWQEGGPCPLCPGEEVCPLRARFLPARIWLSTPEELRALGKRAARIEKRKQKQGRPRPSAPQKPAPQMGFLFEMKGKDEAA